MACLEVELPAAPTLPGGLTLEPPIPPFDFDLRVCCKLLQFSLSPAPLALGVALNPAIQAAILEALQQVQDFLDGLPLDCPRE